MFQSVFTKARMGLENDPLLEDTETSMVRPILYLFRIFNNILLLNVMVKISSRIPKFPNFINTDFPTCTESIHLVHYMYQANLPTFLQHIDQQRVYSISTLVDLFKWRLNMLFVDLCQSGEMNWGAKESCHHSI